jgi:hypothetical protein
MTRPYHSPSSIATGDPSRDGCEYAWAMCYILGIRDPFIDYADIEAGRVKVLPRDVKPSGSHECTPGQASCALGVAMHAILEAWYRGEKPAWGTFPGRVAESGRHLLPSPNECGWLDPEGAIGDEPSSLPRPLRKHSVATVMTVHGVAFGGFRDMMGILSPAAWDRLGLGVLDAPRGYLLVDYKSTKSIAKWAKSPSAVRDDVAANAYALDAMRVFGIDAIACRWVYFETGATRRAIAVDFVITRANAMRVLEAQAALAKHLDTITVETAVKNPDACGRYGGCPHHVTRGGPCDARRSLGKLIQSARRKQGSTMALSIEEMKKAFGSGAATAPAAPTTDAPPPPPPPAAKPRATRAAKPPPPPVVEAPAAVEPTAPVVVNLAAVLAMSDDMGAAQGALEDAGTAFDAAQVEFTTAQDACTAAAAALDAAQGVVNALATKIREALGS